jgi:outer membrane lipoprotein-sorting protein
VKRFIASLAVVALFVAAFYFSPAEANGELDQILANMQAAAKKVSTIKSDIGQVKRFSIGGREAYQGQMLFKHVGQADKLRINYTNGNQISVDSKEAVLYQPAINQAIIISRGKLASENEELAFFSTPYKLTAPQIKERYDIAHGGNEGNTVVLELKPKGKSTVKKMKWWVDQSIWLPSKIETLDQSGDTTIFTLSNMQLNPKIADGDFKIKLPSGVKLIQK